MELINVKKLSSKEKIQAEFWLLLLYGFRFYMFNMNSANFID